MSVSGVRHTVPGREDGDVQRDTPRRELVVFLIPSLHAGGAERVLVTLLRHFDRSRFRLVLAVVDMRGAVFTRDLPPDVDVIDLQCSRVRYALTKVARLLWQLRPATVFSTLGHLNVALAMIRPFLPAGVRYVARESSLVTSTVQSYAWAGLWRWAYRRFYRRFDLVICQSRAMRDDLMEHFGFPEGKLVTIHNPVDTQRVLGLAAQPMPEPAAPVEPPSEPRPIRLVAVGRLAHEKGFDLLIEAVARCNDPRLRVCIVGEGPLRAELEQLAQRRGVSHQVRFAGFQQNPYPFMAGADGLILSSRFEGFPNVVIEALACGTPVISTPAMGGVREILDAVPGCVMAESIDSAGLADAIARWARQPRQRLDGEAVVAPYAVARIVARYEQVLQAQTVSTRGPR